MFRNGRVLKYTEPLYHGGGDLETDLSPEVSSRIPSSLPFLLISVIVEIYGEQSAEKGEDDRTDALVTEYPLRTTEVRSVCFSLRLVCIHALSSLTLRASRVRYPLATIG